MSRLTNSDYMIETIGKNAGLVWKALNENGAMNVKALKKVTKIRTEKDLHAALGWLAREEKLAFTEKEQELQVSLL